MMTMAPLVSLQADPASGVVKRLCCDGAELELSGGGAEFGDWYGFFSQDRLGGTNVQVERSEVTVEPTRSRGSFDVRLPSGLYRLCFTDWLQEGELRRDYQLESLGRGALGDFVLRTAVRRADFPSAEINDGVRRPHRGQNRMRQFKTKQATLERSEARLRCILTDVEAPARLGVYTYIRDAKTQEWIMHHRLLTENGASDEYVLRVRYRAFSSRNAAWVKPLRHVLWRAAERNPWIRPTVQVGGNIATAPGERWIMRSIVRVELAEVAA